MIASVEQCGRWSKVVVPPEFADPLEVKLSLTFPQQILLQLLQKYPGHKFLGWSLAVLVTISGDDKASVWT